jgi:hypothetical protein
MTYYDWKEGEIKCKECDWSGHGRDAELGEMFSDGAEYHCPKCGQRFGFVAFPTVEENLSDPRAAAADRLAAEIRQARHDQFQQSKLVSASQLPDLDPIPQTLAWDVVGDPFSETFVVIRNGEQEIWRELSWYENFHRFAEVAAILRQKYGKALRDLIPTPRSGDDLYGDRFSAITHVDRIREALASGGDLPEAP